MSAPGVRIHLKLLTLFCISISTALSDQEKKMVIWKQTGDYVTIQCNLPKDNSQECLYIKKGIHKDVDIFFKSKSSDTATFSDIVRDRMEINDNFPNIGIVLRNLSLDDTGVYWCQYQKLDLASSKFVQTEGNGSVLLVVTDRVAVTEKSKAEECEQPDKNLAVTTVAISSVVFLIIILIFLMFIIRKVKSSHAQDKPRPLPNNDVYEDMRGTIRR